MDLIIHDNLTRIWMACPLNYLTRHLNSMEIPVHWEGFLNKLTRRTEKSYIACSEILCGSETLILCRDIHALISLVAVKLRTSAGLQQVSTSTRGLTTLARHLCCFLYIFNSGMLTFDNLVNSVKDLRRTVKDFQSTYFIKIKPSWVNQAPHRNSNPGRPAHSRLVRWMLYRLGSEGCVRGGV